MHFRALDLAPLQMRLCPRRWLQAKYKLSNVI